MDDEKELIAISHTDGNTEKVQVITYLISDDNQRNYIVYFKDEVQGVDNDHVIYISKLIDNNGLLNVEEITEDSEWIEVQTLLKKIANA